MAKQMGQIMTPYSKAAPAPASSRFLGVDWARFWQWLGGTYKGKFSTLASCLLLLAVILTLVSAQAISRSSDDLMTIAQGSVPSVDAAQSMSQYIEDIDAKAADYLVTAELTQYASCVLPEQPRTTYSLTVHDCDDQTISSEMLLFNQQLYLAAHNVTYPGERTAIERIMAGSQEYMAAIERMRTEYIQAKDKGDASEPHLQNAWKAYLDASQVLHTKIGWQLPQDSDGHIIFPEANPPVCTLTSQGDSVPAEQWAAGSIEDNITCLNNINKTSLDNAYVDTQNFLSGTFALLVLLCGLLTLLLLCGSIYMAVTTHRVFNLGLVPAFLVGLVLSANLLSLFGTMMGQHGSFGQAVKDDYDSVYYAAQLKRYGTMANGDESRWLISLKFNDQEQARHWQNDWELNIRQVNTLISHAQQNRTWPEEDQPLADMSQYWKSYTDIDTRIRTTAKDQNDDQRIADAEMLSTGQSNDTFNTFSNAVDRLSQANRSHYGGTVASTQSALSLYVLLCSILFPLVGFASVWGIGRRFRDF
ncbi:hypothetical protein KSC_079250 [Ktedonobacter sp. SOSP1-52]|uniref:tetratricopeptide repeat protein n=1 Tax=Ktedonobacter sp. SOSP1-52 TaxID=2778366 RepID=UPI00191542C7|nr:tetratricopeptide repeat protein [Ktedonobacter sp. SOSP1-52]GHO69033.1 hypothetical protein KSC_079250 [Ktedonobacter sp. SOSP1-52]